MMMVLLWATSPFAADTAPTSTTSTASTVFDLDDEDEATSGPTLKAEAVSEAMSKNAWAISDCYTRNAVRGQSGRMTVEFHVLGDGVVSEAKVQASDLKNPALEGCIVESVKKVRFKATGGAETVATFPFVF
jgi:TonB family protein